MEILKRLLVCTLSSLTFVMVGMAIAVFTPRIANWFMSLPELGKIAIIAFVILFIVFNIKYDEDYIEW